MGNNLVIYLDQNKWIEIAKAALRRPGTEHYSELVDRIKEKVQAGEWVFPLSVIHHLETMARMNDRSRMELADVMGVISQNYSIIPFFLARKAEFNNSLLQVRNQQPIDFSSEIVSKDFARAVGLDGIKPEIRGPISEKQKEILKVKAQEIMDNTNMFFELMKNEPNRAFVTEMDQENEYNVKQFESLRANYTRYPKEHRYSAFIIYNYIDQYKHDLSEFYATMQAQGIPREEAIPKEVFATKESTLHFLESVPSFSVQVKLAFEIINNVSRPIDKNDYKDIAFLATAVPYCDVVVTERYWVDIIKRYKLDRKYNTIVTKDLNDLLSL